MRGKHFDSIAETADGRITPAGAGKTRPFTGSGIIRQDHPRRCGENYYLRVSAASCAGITPAGAGKTYGCRRSPWRLGDHPRRCGENVPTRPLRSAFSGSPPQVRGKRNSQYYRVRKPRITPAGAGKTVFGTDRRTAAEDHPRRCGENSAAKHLTSAGTGSPPQVRGKPSISLIFVPPVRITPAGAGKTTSQRSYKSLI